MQSTNSKKLCGKKYERFSRKILIQKGFEICATNYIGRFAEIDLIATKDNCLYFFEVKYRSIDHLDVLEHYLNTQYQKFKKQVKYYCCLNGTGFKAVSCYLFLYSKVAKNRVKLYCYKLPRCETLNLL